MRDIFALPNLQSHSKSQNLTVFQGQFLLHTHKKKDFVQKKSEINDNLKR